jgi:hypothetical protein
LRYWIPRRTVWYCSFGLTTLVTAIAYLESEAAIRGTIGVRSSIGSYKTQGTGFSQNATVWGADLYEDTDNGARLHSSLNWVSQPGGQRLGAWSVGAQDLDWHGSKTALCIGTNQLPLRDLPKWLADAYASRLTFTGIDLRTRRNNTSLGVFAGRRAFITGIVGGELEITPQSIYGVTATTHPRPRLAISSTAVSSQGNQIFEGNPLPTGKAFRIDTNYALAERISLLSEVGFSWPTTKQPGNPRSLILGIAWKSPKAAAEIDYQNIGSAYVFPEDLLTLGTNGWLFTGSYDPSDRLALYATGELRHKSTPDASLDYAGYSVFGFLDCFRAAVLGLSVSGYRAHQASPSVSSSSAGRVDATFGSPIGTCSIQLRASARKGIDVYETGDRRNTFEGGLDFYGPRTGLGEPYLKIRRLWEKHETVDRCREYSLAAVGLMSKLAPTVYVRGELGREGRRNPSFVSQFYLAASLDWRLTHNTVLSASVRRSANRYTLFGDQNATTAYLILTHNVAWGLTSSARRRLEDSPGEAFGRITGRVYWDSNANGLFDAEDTPLEGVRLRLGIGDVLTGRSGEYAVETVKVGSQSITLDELTVPVQYQLRGRACRIVQVKPDSTTRVDYTVSRLCCVVGTVMLRQGSAPLRPLSDVIVFANGLDGSVALTRTDSDGRFALDGLSPGTYTLGVADTCLPQFTRNPGNITVTLREMGESANGNITVDADSRPEKRYRF